MMLAQQDSAPEKVSNALHIYLWSLGISPLA